MKTLFMRTKKGLKGISFTILLIISIALHAQDSDTTVTTKTKEFKQAINFCPLALAFGIYSVNYERLLNKHHAFLIRGDYETVPQNFSDANIDVSGMAGIVNYCYHIKGGLKSLFVGTFAR